jgi:hypothetical protein
MRAPSFILSRWLLAVVAIAPAFVAIRVQKKHWINIPIWDEWDTPGTALLHQAQGVLSWADLFAQHNESRKVIPRLIHLGIASLAGWDVRQGMALTLLCVCAVSGFALFYLRQPGSRLSPQAFFAWILINLFLFAPSQYENFLSGFTFEILIPFLCLFGCCTINLSRCSLPAKVVCNSILALVSTYTFANGMLLWAFAIPIPTVQDRPRKRSVLLWYLSYFAIGIISVAFYFVSYRRPEILPPSATLRQSPQVLEFLVVWLGAVVRSPVVNPRLSGALAWLLLTAVVGGAFVVLRRNRGRWTAYYPWLLILAFTLGSGVVTAVGRVNIGIDSVFNTLFYGFSGMRYNLTSVFAYVGTIGLFFRLYQDRMLFQPALRIGSRAALIILCPLLALAWVEMFLDESIRVNQFQANRKRARVAVIWSRAIPDNPEIFLAYPYPDGFAQRIETMRAAGLLKLPKPDDSLLQIIRKAPAAAEPSGGKLTLCEARGNGYYRLAGWARNPIKNSTANYVVLGWQEADNSFHPLTAISTGIMRPEVAQIHGPALAKGGFDQEIELSNSPPQSAIIKGWAIDWDTQQAFPMEGALWLDRPHS